ncbi:hypothetical protein PR048_014333 [Dryococelus australis]|uniref:Uncharacterized protein n=1 Tax=Dryococelus australis TaxID=614101 RepID=A0ABQ9HDX8_9NEOP|nr:hypothetical protein PR048_014333 [Dryococelus australis]
MRSFCYQTNNRIKTSSNLAEEARLMNHYRLHKLIAKSFYEIMKTEETNIIRISFDTVSEVFYARQVWLYNLTFVLNEKDQNTSNTSVYTWTEDESGRGCNEVTSALSHIFWKTSYGKKGTIIEPNEYRKVFATGATVNVLGTDWAISNFMDASKKTLQRVLIYSKEHQTNIGIINTHNGLPTTVKGTKSTELLHEEYKNVPVLPEENHISQKKRQEGVGKLLKFVMLSEHARMFYKNALSDIA